MSQNKFVSLKKQIKDFLILYFIFPIIFLSLIGYVVIYSLQYSAIKKESQKEFNFIQKSLDELLSKYDLALKELKNRSLDFENIYKIKNEFDLKGNFIVLDKNFKPTIESSSLVRGSSLNSNWGILKKLKNSEGIVLESEEMRFLNEKKTILTMGSKVKNLADKSYNYILFYILDSEIEDIFKKIEINGNYIFTDKNGYILKRNTNNYSDNLNRIEMPVNKKNIFFKSGIYNSKLHIYIYRDLDFMLVKIFEQIVYFITIFIFLITCIFLIINYFINKKLAVIDKIISAIKSTGKGQLNNFLEVETNDELRIIATSYNKMLLDIKNLIEINKREFENNINLEIKQLESQFNPHFLFNTLEMLKYTIKKDVKMSNKIILNISSILRFSIDNRKTIISLGENIKFIESYLEIQKYRFGDDFSYSIDIESNLNNQKTPKLIFQPIVENSIKYGFSSKDKLHIDIRGKLQKGSLVIYFLDDGDGLSKDELIEIRKNLKKDNVTNHIGLYNINRRIKLYYGEKYGVKILSRKGRGTLVKIVLPEDME
ncbi:sensor histidine kinase [Cetobacterium sp. 2G large]|uniref:sensor histidine kinase n=1 Tax=Cetobacterium sp. 2G large TaxID=2759680 RepID=UPI00163BAA7E|nr:histidine kinase [Cetobacterium sp. 2G large]MBC2852417.1 histidine kinase [Cetobacterium sp. 2G large]